MIDIKYNEDVLVLTNWEKKDITFNIAENLVFMDKIWVSFPWEYEKSGILLEVKEYSNSLFYNFLFDSKNIVIITDDNFEIKEDILSFFGDIDVLIIVWTKQAIKIFENIEAKLVIPYWEWKDLFLNSLWQNLEEVNFYKIKWDFSLDNTEFVNLWK